MFVGNAASIPDLQAMAPDMYAGVVGWLSVNARL
jgi:hypothetical protein